MLNMWRPLRHAQTRDRVCRYHFVETGALHQREAPPGLARVGVILSRRTASLNP